MSRNLHIELSDKAFAALQRKAEADGTSPSKLASACVERQFNGTGAPFSDEQIQAARQRFERHFGQVDVDDPTGADNASIDADLADEYGNTRESD